MLGGAVEADDDVVEHGEILEEPDVLECAGDAGGLIWAGRLPSIRRLPSRMLSGCGGVDAGDDVECGGFARAVGADEALRSPLCRVREKSLTATRPPNRRVT